MPAFALGGIELGVATAATQIEGGNADTIWHRWADAGGARDRSTPAIADDHWRRIDEDTRLLASLGVAHYRLGIEWARVEPFPSAFSEEALAHYREELTALREAGIRPLVTLHHFNDPVWFSELGGFRGEYAHTIFLRYVERIVRELGDLVSDWVTINEPMVFVEHGYRQGIWPPGIRSPRAALQVAGGLARAHIHAYRLIHRLQPDARVGVANAVLAIDPARPLNPADRAGAKAAAWLFQDAFILASHRGRFLAPLVQPREIRPGRYYDFVGINYYTRGVVRGTRGQTASRVPVNDLGWEILPEGIARVSAALHERLGGPLWITENGTADRADAFRARFIHDHLLEMVDSGLPFERYYHWTFVDNWEWAEGHTAAFGLFELDPATQTRTPRPSADFYADVIAHHGVTTEAYRRWVAPQQYRING